MIRIPLEPGRVALATAGRDEGKRFVVVGIIDNEYVLIANGVTRTVKHPKRKKKKHLRATKYMMEMPGEGQVTDAELRDFIIGAFPPAGSDVSGSSVMKEGVKGCPSLM